MLEENTSLQNDETRKGNMVTQFCAIVGMEGNVFPVDIEPIKSVGHLKDAIWSKAITEEQKRGNVTSDLQPRKKTHGDGANVDEGSLLVVHHKSEQEFNVLQIQLMWI